MLDTALLHPSTMSSTIPSPPRRARKRSPQIAFASDPTPPQSRPPSRAHTKRVRRPAAVSERPAWVSERDLSPRVSERIPAAAEIAINWSGNGETEAGRRVGELMDGISGVTVMVFLGLCGDEVLGALAGVGGLLQGLGARVLGVSLGQPAPGVGSLVPMVFDVNRTLTTSLGLLHPLGGGRVALDAVVVMDEERRARCVLPVGWGERSAGGDGENRVENVVGRVVRGVEWLGEEKRGREWVCENSGMEMEVVV